MKNASRIALGLLMLVSAACGTRNEDINRVVDPYMPKSYFEGEWYVRNTVVDMPPDHGWMSIADGDWLMLERFKWEITENELIGWRTYSYAPGSDAELVPGGNDFYKGEAVVRYRILGHFDITRRFDPTTGEQGNEIVENMDRQWYDRANIRVDWANLVATTRNYTSYIADPYGFDAVIGDGFNPISRIGSAERPGEAKRNRFEPDYFEILQREVVIPDVAAWFGLYGVPFTGNSAAAAIDVRTSFYKVPASDYQPQPMPPAVTLEDPESGEEVRDANGFRVQVPVNDRFGYFGSLGRNTFDENRGMVQSGQIFNASRFNLWERNVDANGNVIPIAERAPKREAITYYSNVEHPEQLWQASQEVAAQWNKAFRETVWKVAPERYTGELDATGVPSDVPDMFVLKRNSCNVANVETILSGLDGVTVKLRSGEMDIVEAITKAAARTTVNNLITPFDGTIASVRSRFDAAQAGINSYTCSAADESSFTQLQLQETQALNDLERICSALEFYTNDDISTGYKAPLNVDGFGYQRLGDVRYSLFNLLVSEFQAGWLGLGPPYADPITGETISATANIAVNGLDTYAARAAQWVGVMNGDDTLTELAFGQNISDYMDDKLVKSAALVTKKKNGGVERAIESRMSALLSNGRENVLREIAPQTLAQQLSPIAGTALEQKFITPADVQMFASRNGSTDMEAVMEAVSPLRGNNTYDTRHARHQAILRMGQRAMDPPEMIDNMVVGRALELTNEDCGSRFRTLRADIYKAVQLHEVGHNTGLFHNFAGSTDALNFGPTFWEIEQLSPDLDTAANELAGDNTPRAQDRLTSINRCLDAVQRAQADIGNDVNIDDELQNITTQDCLRQSEGMYSSIMDYHANWNSDANGLGMYDLAATKFAYGNLVETLPNLREEFRNPTVLKDALFYDDWRDIPAMFEGATRTEQIANMHERDYKVMEWGTSSTRMSNTGDEAPYRFGYGAYPEPQTKVFDFGPDTQTNAQFQLLRYYQHYFFSHFARDRLWDFFEAVGPVAGSDGAVFDDFTEKMQWMFYYRTQDPKFTPDTYMYQDYLATTRTGLNLLSNVIGEPLSGRFHSVPKFRIFGIGNEGAEERTLEPSDVLMPAAFFNFCDVEAVNEGEDGVFARPNPGYSYTQIPLGDGRPTFIGFRDDYEDYFITYVGNYWTKTEALIALGRNFAFFPRLDADADQRTYDVSWYRMFPNEVSTIFTKLASQQGFLELGPLYDPAAKKVIFRDLIDAETGEQPDYSGLQKIPAQIAINHEFMALLVGNILMSSPTDDTLDFAKTLRVAQAGGEDDMSAYDAAQAVDDAAGCVEGDADYYDCATVATFTHPVTGLTYRALKVGQGAEVSGGFNLIRRLNALKERFVRNQACLEEVETTERSDDPYCGCYTNDRLDPGAGVVCNAAGYQFEAAGEPLCSLIDVRFRAEASRESLDGLVDYVNDLRSINEILGN
jgi:hypothetical protein